MRCDTRAACCMLCVTMTIVRSSRSSDTRSSIFAVAIGSSALAGSSISSTSGSTASARAMHRRCCWPPERPRPDSSRRSFTSSQSAAWRSARSTRSAMRPALAHARDAEAVRDVLEDRLRERVRALEHHADAAPHEHRVDVRPVDGLAVELDVPVTETPGTVSFMRLSERRNVLLPQPLGPMSASTCSAVDVDRHVFDGDLLAVADGEIRSRASSVGQLVPGDGCAAATTAGTLEARARVQCLQCDVRVTSTTFHGLEARLPPDGCSRCEARARVRAVRRGRTGTMALPR